MGIAPFTAQADSRTREILEDLEQVLLAFMRKHGITHEQYRVATQILVDTVKKGEESLLYDVFLEAEPTDIGNRQRAGSPEAIEGPFYLPGAPALEQPYIMPMRDGEPGEVLFSRASSRSSQDEGGFDDSILAPLMYVSARLHRRDDPRKAERYTQSMQAWYLRPTIVCAAPLSRQRGTGPMNCPIRCHISTGFEYIGKCPL